MKLRNFKIRNKLLLIYICCVALPIIITDAVIISTVNHSTKERRLKEYQYSMERVEYNLREIIKGCILFTTNLYKDNELDKFLEEDFQSYVDYYEVYLDLLNNQRLSYSYNNGTLYKIQIFCDNPTILSGGHIAKIESIEDTEWYKAYKEQSDDVYVHTYYDENRKRIAGGGTSRTISIIRNMNNFSSSREKILKIDIDYNFMLQEVKNEKLDADLYVANKNHILFSNLSKENSMREFDSLLSISSKDSTMSQRFKVANENWTIFLYEENSNFWSDLMENKSIWLLISFNCFVPTLLIYIVGRSISSRLSLVVQAMNQVKKEKFEVITTISGRDEIGDVIRSYNLMVIKIKNLIEVVFKEKEEKQVLELGKKEAQLKALQSQINPHFLFNTLESIRMRSLIKKEEETAEIMGHLALVIRKSMDWTMDHIKVIEEVSFVEKYINIQRYRFGEKIKFKVWVLEECFSYYVPKLSIATFIENACIHGIEASEKEGVISLEIKREEEFLLIHIIDNGRGFYKEDLESLNQLLAEGNYEMLYHQKSTGMLNAYIRLKVFCEGNFIFNIESEKERGTKICIKIPIIYCKLSTRKET